MSNLTTTGGTSYPGALDSVTVLVDGAAGDQILARHPNGLGNAVIALETELGTDPAGSAVDLKTRLAVALNNDGTVKSTVLVAGNGAQIAYAAGVFTIGWSPDGPGYLQNAGLEVTPNSPVANACRIRIVQRTGATPTAAAPIRVAMRSATTTAAAANATYVVREITGDTQMALSSGSSLNFINNQIGRFYVWLIDNNGVLETAVSRDARFSEAELWSTTAEGGAGGADADDLLYSTTARAAVPICCYAQVDVRCPTAGNWTQSPMTMNIMGQGVKRTGEIVQTVRTATTSVATTSSAIPLDDTVPLVGEGRTMQWATMAATSPVNRVRVRHHAPYYWTTSNPINFALFRTATTTADYAISYLGGTNGAGSDIFLEFATLAASTANVGWYLNAGVAAGVLTFNGQNSARIFGGVTTATMELWEEAS